jgi:hypothetical protein
MAFITSLSGYIPLKFDRMAYVLTTKVNALVQSGVIVASPRMDRFMQKGGVLFEMPFWNDLANVASRQPTETASILFAGGTNDPVPQGLTSSKEIAARTSRNQSWGVTDLTDSLDLDGDPLAFILGRIATYRSWKLQEMFLFECKGIFADNALAPTGTDIHVQNDMTLDISDAAGVGVFQPGVTTFGAAAHIKAIQLLGDNKRKLGIILMHSIIEAGISLQDLIETVKDSQGQTLYTTFMGMRVIIDDDMTEITTGVYDTYYFGAGAFVLGQGQHKNPLEEERHAGAGNGNGETVVYNRWEWCLHPVGYQWKVASTGAGPSDAELQAAASWSRIYPERKMYKIVRVRSREA